MREPKEEQRAPPAQPPRDAPGMGAATAAGRIHPACSGAEKRVLSAQPTLTLHLSPTDPPGQHPLWVPSTELSTAASSRRLPPALPPGHSSWLGPGSCWCPQSQAAPTGDWTAQGRGLSGLQPAGLPLQLASTHLQAHPGSQASHGAGPRAEALSRLRRWPVYPETTVQMVETLVGAPPSARAPQQDLRGLLGPGSERGPHVAWLWKRRGFGGSRTLRSGPGASVTYHLQFWRCLLWWSSKPQA